MNSKLNVNSGSFGSYVFYKRAMNMLLIYPENIKLYEKCLVLKCVNVAILKGRENSYFRTSFVPYDL